MISAVPLLLLNVPTINCVALAVVFWLILDECLFVFGKTLFMRKMRYN